MKYFVTHDGKYRIESLSPSTFPGALKVMREALFQDELVSIATEVNKNPKAVEELLELCADAALDGVSLVAVVVDTGEVAAAVFNKIKLRASDGTETPFIDIFLKERCTQPSARSLVQLMIDVDEKANLLEVYDVDCSFDLMLLGTLREHRVHKLGNYLGVFSVEVARTVKDGSAVPLRVEDLGPKYSHLKNRKPMNTYPKICQALCTVKTTQNLIERYNYILHLTIPFSEFSYNGKTFSERIGDENAVCQVYVLPLF